MIGGPSASIKVRWTELEELMLLGRGPSVSTQKGGNFHITISIECVGINRSGARV
jgi:hypothetical protein